MSLTAEVTLTWLPMMNVPGAFGEMVLFEPTTPVLAVSTLLELPKILTLSANAWLLTPNAAAFSPVD